MLYDILALIKGTPFIGTLVFNVTIKWRQYFAVTKKVVESGEQLITSVTKALINGPDLFTLTPKGGLELLLRLLHLLPITGIRRKGELK